MRKHFILPGIVAAVLTAGILFSCSQEQSAFSDGQSAPNLLVVYTDQQNRWTVGAYGDRNASTPHLDSLAKEGAVFNNFFTVHGMCTASRGSFLTGRYPHAHGAFYNQVPLNKTEKTLAALLQEQGYDTGYAGKWHLNGKEWPGWIEGADAMGFSDSQFMYNGGHFKRIGERPSDRPVVFLPESMSGKEKARQLSDAGDVVFTKEWIGDEQTYTTDWLTNKAIEFIRKKREKPFFFMLSIPDPHPPYAVRQPYSGMYDPEKISLPETLFQGDGEKPDWAGSGNGTPVRGETREEKAAWLKRVTAQYLGESACIDDNVGRVLDALRDTDQIDNTIILFTTDHGDLLGEHGLVGKGLPYESVYRLPLIIRWPEKIRAGTVVSDVVSAVDILPTLTALMGVQTGGREQGRDASPLVTGGNAGWINESFMHFNSRGDKKHRSHLGIWTERYMLAYVRDGEPVLFDRQNDPLQLRNQFRNPEYAAAVRTLTERIVAHCDRVGDPEVAWLKEVISWSAAGTPEQSDR